MISQGTQYDPGRHHTIPANDFVKIVQRDLLAPMVAAVRDMRSGNWLLVEWLDHVRGRMQELLVLGSTPYGTREQIKSLRSMIRGSDEHCRVREKNRKILQGFEAEGDRQDTEAQEDYSDAYRDWMRRPGRCNTNRVAVPG